MVTVVPVTRPSSPSVLNPQHQTLPAGARVQVAGAHGDEGDGRLHTDGECALTVGGCDAEGAGGVAAPAHRQAFLRETAGVPSPRADGAPLGGAPPGARAPPR